MPLTRSLRAKHREAVWLLLCASDNLVAVSGADHIINGPEVFRPDMSAVGKQINVSNVLQGEEAFAFGVSGIADIDIPIYVHYWHVANASTPLEQGETDGAAHVIDEIIRTIAASGNNQGRLADPDGGALTLNLGLQPVTVAAVPDRESNMNLYRVTFTFNTKVNASLVRTN